MTVAATELATVHIDALDRHVHYRPGTSDEQVLEDVFIRGYHIPPVDLNPATVLDCGAHIGLTMLDYRHLWPNAEIVGVEMDAGNCALARLNTPDPVLCAAVEDYPEDATRLGWYSPETESWAYTLDDNGTCPRCAIRVPLRAIIDELSWDTVDFLKLDIEGSERSVINYAELEHVNALLVELHQGYERPQAIQDLRRLGFDAEPQYKHPNAVWAWRP